MTSGCSSRCELELLNPTYGRIDNGVPTGRHVVRGQPDWMVHLKRIVGEVLPRVGQQIGVSKRVRGLPFDIRIQQGGRIEGGIGRLAEEPSLRVELHAQGDLISGTHGARSHEDRDGLVIRRCGIPWNDIRRPNPLVAQRQMEIRMTARHPVNGGHNAVEEESETSIAEVRVSGRGTVYTHSTVAAAPTGFDDMAPYTVAVVDLEEGGRLLAWIGETIDEVEIGMPVQVVPRIFEEVEDIRVYYTVEQPGTTWGMAPQGR